PTLSELTPRQRKVALISGVAALAVIGFGVSLALRGATSSIHSGADAAEAPVTQPAAPPVPVVTPRLAEAPPSPLPSASSSKSDAELSAEEQKKKDKKKRAGAGVVAPSPASPDYGI